jgi:hypothetical protein
MPSPAGSINLQPWGGVTSRTKKDSM